MGTHDNGLKVWLNGWMHGVALMVRNELRRRLGPLATLALVAMLGVGATLGAFVMAHRTDRAYPEHAAAANIADLVVNPSLATGDAERVAAAAVPARSAARAHPAEILRAA